MIMRSKLAVLACGLITLGAILTGCATIIEGSDHTLAIGSSPSQAKVVINRATASGQGIQVYEGVTPTTVKLSRKNEYVVTISAPGYQDVSVPITHAGVQEAFIANILCGGLIGMVVDYSNGAMYKMDPETINVGLEYASVPAVSDSPVLCAILLVSDHEGVVSTYTVPLDESF